MPSHDEQGPPSGATDARPTRRLPFIAISVWAVLFGLGSSTWHPIPIGVWHDDGAYVLIASSIAEGDGLRWSGVSGTPPAAKFPPLFPSMVAGVLRWGPDTANAAPALARLNLGIMAAAGAAFFLFTVLRLGLTPLVGAAVTLGLWTAPDLWWLAAVPLSEPLFLLTSVLVLLAAPRTDGRWGPRTVLLLLGAFGLAFHTRTVGVALLGGALLAVVARRAWRTAAVLAAGGFSVVLPWLLWSRSATQDIPEPLRDVLGSYGGWLSGEVVRSPAAYTVFAASNAWDIWHTLTGMLVPPASGALLNVLAVALLLCVATGAVVVWRGSSVAVLATVLYLGIVALWPFQSTRLVAPALPLVALSAGFGVLAWTKAIQARVGGARRLPVWATVGAVAAFAGSNLVELVPGRHLTDLDIRARALAAASEAVGNWVPPDGVVGAPELWAGLHIYTGRTVAPSARFLPLATEGPSWGTPDQQFRLWVVAGLDHVLVEHGGGVHGEALDRLDAECPGGAVQLLATMPGAFLTRIAWDVPCRERLGLDGTLADGP